MAYLDWLIIGGGIHGTHLAIRLLAAKKVAPERLRVIDPHPGPLACWDHCTRNVGMEFLRSPSVHQLGASPFALYDFLKPSAQSAGFAGDAKIFAPPYNRPSLALFRAHCRALTAQYGIPRVWLQGRVSKLEVVGPSVAVTTDQGVLHARKVILAIGGAEQLQWPGWADELRRGGVVVEHVFAESFVRTPTAGVVAVVGGGISAAQLALAYASSQPGRVVLIRHHPPRIAQFDSDPGWLGPKFLTKFHRQPDLGRRRREIFAARHRGSMPEDVAWALQEATAQGLVRVVEGDICGGVPTSQGCRLQTTSGVAVAVESVVLATGFATHRPGGDWLDKAIAQLGLPCAACGYPKVDKALRWHPQVHVTGPLAELEVGPASRNIAGARMAAERIVATA